MNVKGSINSKSGITIRYIIALSVIAFLAIAGQFVIQMLVDNQMGDSHLINIAGRQRMLSQRIAKAVFALHHVEGAQREKRILELEQVTELWKKSHKALLFGSKELNLPGKNSESILQLFSRLEPYYLRLEQNIEVLLTELKKTQPSEPNIDSYSSLILNNETEFLPIMDAIVFQYDREARGRLELLKRTEMIILGIILLFLILMAFCVFMPAVKKIDTTMNQLQESERKTKEAMEIRMRFTSIASHELRIPLAAISLALEYVSVSMKEGLDEKQERFFEIIHSNISRLSRLTNNLLLFQKLESGKMLFDINENSIDDVIREAVRSMVSVAKKKGLELEAAVSGQIPKVRFDRDRVLEVIMNLVDNAIKYTEKGTVVIAAVQEENVVHVSIKDTGQGIREEDLPRLFQGFERLRERASEGTGLGLAISREIIKGHGGNIWAESLEGEGSIFHFTLPINY